jgi:PHS family inorganic phosphate transporter-like MFS transporter
VLLLTSQRGDVGTPDFPEPDWAKQVLLGITFAACAGGMLAFGVLGDVAGRRVGLLASLWAVLVGALASALVPTGASRGPYEGLALARVVLGAGVGGLYPNAAALAHEDEGEAAGEGEDEDEKINGSSSAEKTAWSFVWQTPGSVAPYVVALAPLAALGGTPAFSQAAWRVVLACGALPAAAAIALLPAPPAASVGVVVGGGSGVVGGGSAPGATGAPASAAWTPALSRTLLGTAGCWFLYDVSAYGVGVNTPALLQAIFPAESVRAVLLQAVGSHAAAALGAVCAVLALRARGAAWLQRAGFAAIAAAAALLGALFSAAPGGGALAAAKLAALQLLTFALAWGPNVSTYVLPAQLFPARWRARAHGAAAAAGKLGAVVGTFAFAPVATAAGVAGVMYLQLAVCAAGAALTAGALPWDAGDRADGGGAARRAAEPCDGDGDGDGDGEALLRRQGGS